MGGHRGRGFDLDEGLLEDTGAGKRPPNWAGKGMRVRLPTWGEATAAGAARAAGVKAECVVSQELSRAVSGGATAVPVPRRGVTAPCDRDAKMESKHGEMFIEN